MQLLLVKLDLHFECFKFICTVHKEGYSVALYAIMSFESWLCYEEREMGILDKIKKYVNALLYLIGYYHKELNNSFIPEMKWL